MDKKDDTKHRARYTLEFTLEAMRIVKGGQDVGVTARVLAVPEQTLGNGVSLNETGELPRAGDKPVSVEQRELARLRAGLARVKIDRDILKNFFRRVHRRLQPEAGSFQHRLLDAGRRATHEAVRAATAEAARELFEGHTDVFVMHADQRAPHVGVSLRADRYDGVRWSPRRAALDRWRAVFARNLQDRGVSAGASRQTVRAASRDGRKPCDERAARRGQLIRRRPARRTRARALAVQADAIKAWEQIAAALARSSDPADVRHAVAAVRYLGEAVSGGQEAARLAARSAEQHQVDCFEGPRTASAAKARSSSLANQGRATSATAVRCEPAGRSTPGGTGHRPSGVVGRRTPNSRAALHCGH